MDITKRLNSFTQHFKPYTPIEPPAEIAKRLGIPADQIIKMDANENPFGVPQSVKDALAEARTMHIYPDPAQRDVRRLISEYTSLPADHIVAGNGADELLDLICRIFLKPGDTVLSFSPTFSYYRHVVELNQAKLELLPLSENFRLNLETIRQLDLSRYSAVILCSPNNPTGLTVPTDIAAFFLQHGDLPVIIDEAYYEYAGTTYIEQLKRYPNLIIVRTFSKFFALAGFRVGYGLMHPQIASTMMSVKPPYSVTVPSEIALKACFKNMSVFKDQAGEIKRNREFLMTELNQITGLTAYPSESNFFLCECKGIRAKTLKEDLEQRGIMVRFYASDPALQNFIRITVGTQTQCRKLLDAVKDMLSTQGS